MIDLGAYIEQKNFNNRIDSILVEELKFALSCWIKTFKAIPLQYNIPSIFESAGQFNNCGKVVELVMKYILDNKETKYTHEFDCSDLDVFFKKLKINVEKYNSSTYGYYDDTTNETVTLNLYIKNYNRTYKNIASIESDIEYTIVHELIHAYEDYIRKTRGLPSINTLFDNIDYKKEYRRALSNIHSGDDNIEDEYINKLIAKCRYFLDEQEQKAYLGTVKTCVQKITKKVGPSFRSLKFDEVIDLFKDEYIWEEYKDIYIFIKNINKVDNELLMKIYKYFYTKKLSADEIKDELTKKWNKFEHIFIKNFTKSYASSIQDLKLESFFRPSIDIMKNPYSIYD